MHCYLLTNCNNSWLTLIFTRDVFTSVKHPVANIQQPNLEVTMIAKKKVSKQCETAPPECKQIDD